MNSNPFGQALQLMQLAKDQGLSEGDVQNLFSSPLLSRLFRAAKELDISKVDLAEFLKVLGYEDRYEFEVTFEGFNFTSTLVSSLRGRGCAVHELINDEMFPLTRIRNAGFRMKLVDTKRDFSYGEAKDTVLGNELLIPTYEQALLFAYQYGTEMQASDEKPLIVFPHSPVLDGRGSGRILFLRRSLMGRKLDLSHCIGNFFHRGALVAGVVPEK